MVHDGILVSYHFFRKNYHINISVSLKLKFDTNRPTIGMGNSLHCASDTTEVCPVKRDVSQHRPQAESPTSSCPVQGSKNVQARGIVYNVYAQPIDPTNNMPVNANQQPAPGQREVFCIRRWPWDTFENQQYALGICRLPALSSKGSFNHSQRRYRVDLAIPKSASLSRITCPSVIDAVVI
jgi:hypothetical protein